MGILSIIQSDLVSLAAEARKRFPAIKEAAERAIMRLKSLEEKPEGTEVQGLQRASEDVLRPFFLACESKNPKLVAMAVHSIQKLIAQGAVAKSQTNSLLNNFSNMGEIADEGVQLKELQAMVSLLTNPAFELHSDTMGAALQICLKLYESKFPSVHSTASASLRQIAGLLFERALAEVNALVKAKQTVPSTTSASGPSAPTLPTMTLDSDTSSLQSSEKSRDTATIPASPAPAIVPSVIPASPSDGASNDSVIASMTGPQLGPATPLWTQSAEEILALVPHTLRQLPNVSDAYLLLLDFCNITAGDQPVWLPVKSLPRNFGLELIEVVLATPALYVKLPEMMLLLKDRVCPLLVKLFKQKAEFPLTIRLSRIMLTFIKNYASVLPAETEVFMARLIRVLDAESQLWLRTVQLEVLKSVCLDRSLIRGFFSTYDLRQSADPSSKIFENLVNAVGRFVRTMFDWDDSLVVGQSAYGTPKTRAYIEMLTASEPPSQMNETYIIGAAVDCMIGIADAVSKLCVAPNAVPLALPLTSNNAAAPNSSVLASTNAPPSADDIQLARKMAECSWPSILASLSMLFVKSQDEIFVQSILKTYQSFIYCCGIVGLSIPRQAFLTSLQKFAMPPTVNPSASSDSSGGASGSGSGSADRSATGSASGAIAALSSSSGSSVSDPALPLNAKNLQALKTLLNVATCMGAVLSDSWLPLLETLEQLDRIVGPLVSGPNPSGDLGFLASALQNVPRSAKFLDPDALQHLLSALIRISSLGVNAQPPRTFALQKLVEVINCNLERIEFVWTVAIDHLLLCAEHKKENIRQLSAESIKQTIVDSFTQSASASSESTQKVLLESLERLSKSAYYENRNCALSSLFLILQSAGQHMKAWPLVLSILMTVVSSNDKVLVPLAFKSVEFIGSEFLVNLPIGCLALLISAVGLYGQKATDLNISLTAVSQLWNIVDFLGKEGPNLKSREDTKNNTEKLWLNVFTEIRTLSVDPRPETRNCALVMLFKALSTHGASLAPSLWTAVFNQILFPMLHQVQVSSANAPTDITSHELGKEGGRSVKMLVHHTRDTPQKQWHETLVHAIGGLARIFKTFFGLFTTLPEFEKHWKEALNLIAKVATTDSKEVTMVCIQSLKELLLVQIPGSAMFSRYYWESIWASIEETTVALISMESVTMKALTTIATLATDMYSHYRTTFSTADLKRLLHIMDMLGQFPTSASDTTLTPLQEAIIKFMQILPPIDEALQPAIFSQMLRYISVAVNSNNNTSHSIAATSSSDLLIKPASSTTTANNTTSSSSVVITASNKQQRVCNVPFADRCIFAVVSLFAQAAPNSKAIVMPDVLVMFSQTMEIKFRDYQSPLWSAAVRAYAEVVTSGLPSLKPGPETSRIWNLVIEHAEHFLLHDRSSLPQLTQDGQRTDEGLDIVLLDLLARQLFVRSSHPSTAAHQERLLKLLRVCSTFSNLNRELLAQASFANMFYLSALSGTAENLEIARVVFPVTMSRCREVISRYVTDERQSGAIPLPRQRTEEVHLLLNQLLQLEVPTEVAADRIRIKGAGGSGRRAHLLQLFPLLCDCVTVRDSRMRELLKDILHKVAHELSLE